MAVTRGQSSAQKKLESLTRDFGALKNPQTSKSKQRELDTYKGNFRSAQQDLDEIVRRMVSGQGEAREKYEDFDKRTSAQERDIERFLRRSKSDYDQSFEEQKSRQKAQFKRYDKAVDEVRGDIREYESGSGSTKTETLLSRDDIIQSLADMRKANQSTEELAEQFKTRAGDIDALREERAGDFQALQKDLISSPSVVQAEASRQRQKQLADRARLLNSFTGTGANQSVNDYLNQVETADQTALAETAGQRASEYYQRRTAYQKALSAQVVSDNYYQSLSREAMSGALTGYKNVADTNARIAETSLMNSQYQNNRLISEANLVTGLYGDKLSSINELYSQRGQDLGRYGSEFFQGQGYIQSGNIARMTEFNNMRSKNLQELTQAGDFIGKTADREWRSFESQRDFERRKIQEDRSFLQSFANQLNTQISRELETSRLEGLGRGYEGFMRSVV